MTKTELIGQCLCELFLQRVNESDRDDIPRCILRNLGIIITQFSDYFQLLCCLLVLRVKRYEETLICPFQETFHTGQFCLIQIQIVRCIGVD
jgi:hypothetical protein